MTDVLCIPSFTINIVSVNQLFKNRSLTVIFTPHDFVIQDPSSKMIGQGDLIHGLYCLKPIVDSFPAFNKTCTLNSISSLPLNVHFSYTNKLVVNVVQHSNKIVTLRHNRMGHLSDKMLKILSQNASFSVDSNFSSACYDICPLSKLRRLSFQSHNHMSSCIFYLIHVDVWGPYHTVTHQGMHYFLTIVDDYSRFTWIYLLHTKSEATQKVKDFFALIKTQFGFQIKKLRSANALELALTTFLQQQGTLHQFSCPYRPQQNFVVERKHQHLLNMARSLLFQSKVPLLFWGECVTTTTFL